MTTKQKSAPKTESTISVEDRLVELLAHKTSSEDSHPHHEVPSLGDKVTIGNGDSIWSVSRVSSDGREVNLKIPGSKLERFRVNVEDLHFVGRTTRRKPKAPEKPKIDATEVRKRFTSARQETRRTRSSDRALEKNPQELSSNLNESLKRLVGHCSSEYLRMST